MVTRDELRRVLWTADTFVDFEVGLNSAVRKLREALDDSADNPRFVETVPRRGYRFIAPVTVPAVELAPAAAAAVAGGRAAAGRTVVPQPWWLRRPSAVVPAVGTGAVAGVRRAC